MSIRHFGRTLVLAALAALVCVSIPVASLAQSRTATLADVLGGKLSDGTYDLTIQGLNDPDKILSGITLRKANVSGGRITRADGFGGIQISGFGVDIQQSVQIESNRIVLSGAFGLPVFNLPSGSVSIVLENNTAKLTSGSISLPKMEVPGVFGLTGSAEYDPPRFAASGSVGVPLRPGELVYFGGGFALENRKLTEISATADDLNLQLGNSPAYLQSVSLNIAQLDKLKYLMLSMGMEATAGPEVLGISALSISANGAFAPAMGIISVNGETKLLGFFTMASAGFIYQHPSFAHVEGWGYWSFIKGSAELTVGDMREYFRYTTCGLPNGSQTYQDCLNYADLLIKTSQFAGRNFDLKFKGSVQASITVPDDVWLIGGKSFGSVGIYVTDQYFRGRMEAGTKGFGVYGEVTIYFKSPPDVDWDAGWLSVDHSWETPLQTVYVIDQQSNDAVPYQQWTGSQGGIQVRNTEPESMAIVVFNENMGRVDRIGNTQISSQGIQTLAEQTLTVPQNTKNAVFRLNYQNAAVQQVAMRVMAPNGTVYDQVFLHPESQTANIFVSNPVSGDYKVVVDNEAQLGQFVIDLVVPNEPPQVEITRIQPTGNNNEYLVEWTDSDHEGNGVVSVWLDTDRQGTGKYLLNIFPHDDAQNKQIINANHALIPSGDYYIVVEIDDGVNAPTVVHSHTPIPVHNPDAPHEVTGIAVGGGDGSFRIKWDASTDPNVIGYTVLYTQHPDLGVFENRVAVDDPAQTEWVVEGMPNGAPLLVTVVAVNDKFLSSYPETVLRVVPHKSDGTTPAEIGTNAPQFAEVGHLYIYAPLLHESERHFQGDIASSVEILSGPAGMTVNNNIVTWTPAAGQVGEHAVTLKHTHAIHSGGIQQTVTDEEQFTVAVFMEDDLHQNDDTAFAILSSPPLSAHAGLLYTYKIDVYDLGGVPTFTLLEGPAGMTVDADGDVNWNVPQDAESYYPVRIEVRFSSGETREMSYILDIITPDNTLSPSEVLPTAWSELK